MLYPRATVGEEGKLGSPGTDERAPRCLGKDTEGLRVRVAYCVLGVDSLKLFSIKNSINILFTCNHQ
uniref:Ornithine decarboxylase antizyme 2 n=1 Tax=Pan troglodytes TaxID=9598 RepID=G2HGR9_PANTR|nr:ornithine decarboxylase antizyme 2 [Pan troglodytes]